MKRAGENGVNRLARFGVVAVARDENEQRDETVEAIAADKYLHLRPFAKPQDSQRGVKQLLLIDLEQFVPGEGVEEVRQRLAVMAVAREAGALQHMLHLQAQERNIRGPSAVGS